MFSRSVPSGNRASHVFSRAPQASIPRSKFNRSHGLKTTFNAGYLVPILADEMLPGDTFNLSMTGFARLSTPLFPIMDNMYLETFFFAVPNRLLWDNFQRFMGEQRDPGDSTDFVVPYISTTSLEGDIFDYFGLPVNTVDNVEFNALHLRAYNLIYNEWFRDENLQDSLDVPTDDGPDSAALYTLKRRGKRHDYFTSCLPFPQKGPDVTIPLGSVAPIQGDGTNIQLYSNADATLRDGYLATDGHLYANGYASAASPAHFGPLVGLEVDLSDATAATINELRLAFQTQKLYERDARGGSRYTEIIASHFRVTSPDSRLQRPEYLGGGSTPVLVNPIAQTTPTVGGSPLGRLGAYGVSAPTGHGFTYSATEHCVIVGLACVRADLNYQQGTERMWSRRTRLDYYWPALSHIGEQAVLNKEIFTTGDPSQDDGVFGYQERYAEYRYKPSMITGLFRSSATGTLDSWHLAQDFTPGAPPLNDEFIEEDPPMARIEAVPTEPDFLFDAFFQYYCARPMPVYSVPGLIDHF